jgi:hypothetical protein
MTASSGCAVEADVPAGPPRWAEGSLARRRPVASPGASREAPSGSVAESTRYAPSAMDGGAVDERSVLVTMQGWALAVVPPWTVTGVPLGELAADAEWSGVRMTATTPLRSSDPTGRRFETEALAPVDTARSVKAASAFSQKVWPTGRSGSSALPVALP